MNIQQLRYFLVLADTLSFTKTAEKYYISQTAVSNQIKALEEKLGVQLFQRDNRKVILTPAGKVFVKEALIERDDVAALYDGVIEGKYDIIFNLPLPYGRKKTPIRHLLSSWSAYKKRCL